jgi:hypothetical protein
VAQRAGVPATAVTVVHWGFATFGGLCALLFVASPSEAKPFIPLLTLVPQLFWVGLVVRIARTAGLSEWG